MFPPQPFPKSVMPGLVPGIYVPPPPRPLPARTVMPQDVDARNESGHDVLGVLGVQCEGSRTSGTER